MIKDDFGTVPDDNFGAIPDDNFGAIPDGDTGFVPDKDVVENSFKIEKQQIEQFKVDRLAQAQKEESFQSWYANIAKTNKINPNPDDPQHFYDYRGYFDAMNAGRAQPPQYRPEHKQVRMPDEFKLPGHPDYYTNTDPATWTIDQSNRYIKDHPAETPEQEVEYKVFLDQKKAQAAEIEGRLTGYEKYLRDQANKQIAAGEVYAHEKLLQDPEEMSKFESFMVPYTKGTAGFFTRIAGIEPLEGVYSPEEIKQSEKDHPLASAFGKAAGGLGPMALAVATSGESLLSQIFAFGAAGGISQAGREATEGSLMDPKRNERIVKQTLKSAAYAPLWFYTKAITLGGPLASIGTRAAARGAGGAGIEKASGASNQEAVMSGLMTGALSGISELTPFAIDRINGMVKNKALDSLAETLAKNDEELRNTIIKNSQTISRTGHVPNEEEITKMIRGGLVIETTTNNIPVSQIIRASEKLKKAYMPRDVEIIELHAGAPIPKLTVGQYVRSGEIVGKISKIAGDNAFVVNTLGNEIQVQLKDLHKDILPQEIPDSQLKGVPEEKRDFVRQLYKIENPEVVDELIHSDPDVQKAIKLNQELGSKVFIESADPEEWPEYYHEYVNKAMRSEIPAPQGQPEVILWVGLPASGKTSLAKMLGVDKTHALVDSDDAKLHIPESVQNPSLAPHVQNESAYMAEGLLAERLIEARKNIIWPKIGKTEKSLAQLMDLFHENGYKVALKKNELSKVESKKRSYKRFLEDKRFVPPAYIDDIPDLIIEQIYGKLKLEADEYSSHDVNVSFEESPQLIEEGVSDGYNRYRARKAKELEGPGGLELLPRVPDVSAARSQEGPQESAPKVTSPEGTQDIPPQEALAEPPEDPPLEGKERKFITSIKKSEFTSEELRAAVRGTYDLVSNQKTLEEAKALLNDDIEGAKEKIWNKGPLSRLESTIGMVLIRRYDAEKNLFESTRLAEHLAERATESGQGVQALAMFGRLSPEGVLVFAQRQVLRARENIKQKGVLTNFEKLSKGLKTQGEIDKLVDKLGIPHISGIVASELKKMAENIQTMPPGRDRSIEEALLLKKISDQIPANLLQKTSMIQTMAQLLNPKTFVRNFLGNVAFQVAENVADTLVGTLLDIMVSLKTGKRTIYLPDLQVQAKGLIQGFKEGKQEAFLGIDLKNTQSRYSLPRNGVFDSKVMGAFEKILRISLSATDRAFYQAAFNQSLRNQCRAAKVDEPTGEMLERAHHLGLYRTFQDDNTISKIFVGMKRLFNLGKDWGAGDMIIKYPKTPGSLLDRGIEYSPSAVLKLAWQLARPYVPFGSGDPTDQEESVRTVARGAVGTIFFVGAGLWFAKMGIISGKRAKDKDVAATRQNIGIREYQINASALKRFVFSGFDPEQAILREDDIHETYDWMQPASIGMAIGANLFIDSEANLPDKVINLGAQVLQATKSSSETLERQPLMQGIKKLTSKQTFVEGAFDLLQEIPASFVPTLLNQVRQLTDNTVRNTKDPNYLKEAYNKLAVRVPGLSKTVPERITTLGKPQEMYQLGTNNPFNVFLNPAFVSRYKPDPVSRMVLDIWESTGEAIQFPRVASVKIKLGDQTGEPVELSSGKYREFQQFIGNKTDILFTIRSKDQEFMALPDDEKARKLQTDLTNINLAAKMEVLEYVPKNLSKKQSQDVLMILKLIGEDKEQIDKNLAEDDFGAVPDDNFGAIPEDELGFVAEKQ